MAITNSPLPTREAGQRSTNLSEAYITRFTPAWNRPSSWTANAWRSWVFNQPVAIICRETLIANLLALDWKITPREMKYKDELDGTIKYYTRLLENGGNNPELSLDYSGLVEWVVADLLDIPFGAGAEVGRKGDSENGRVVWLKPLDGATLYPTLNKDYPVVQYWSGLDAVPFPSHAIARTYMTPRPYMDRQGWGIAPPEKVFFALELLNRGDKYYANLLLDIPTSGILDLGDMEKGSAQEWAESFKTFMNEADTSFRIPILYEHNNPVNFISLGKVPNDIMFDRITMKYAAIVASAYGMSLDDIGLSGGAGGGSTLAGTIRSDIKYGKTGFARVKSKLKYFFDQILPPSLQFTFIDYDRELNVAMGRARLASATAFKNFSELKMFSPQELRSQAIADGLFSITLPDTVPSDSEFPDATPANNEPEVVGNPKPVTQGGEGEFNTRSMTDEKKSLIRNRVLQSIPVIHDYLLGAGEDEISVAKSEFTKRPEVVEYVKSMTEELDGSEDDTEVVIYTMLEKILAILEKSIFDSEDDIPYDYIVEQLIGDDNG